MIELIIFDCDGVLVDSEYVVNKVWHETLKSVNFSIDFDELSKLFTGISGKDKIRRLKENYNLDLPQEFLDNRKKIANKAKKDIRIISGVDEALNSITINKCLASGSTINSLNIYKQNNPCLDKHFNESNTFSAEMVENGKPAPDLFFYAAKKMGYKPEQCLVIEDSIAGVKAAVNANMKVIGFTGASTSKSEEHRKELMEAGASTIISDMKKLPQTIKLF